jgi:hypothetical protein
LGNASTEAQALADVQDALKVLDNNNVSAGGTLNERQKRQVRNYLMNGTQVAYQQIHKLLTALEAPDSSIPGWDITTRRVINFQNQIKE